MKLLEDKFSTVQLANGPSNEEAAKHPSDQSQTAKSSPVMNLSALRHDHLSLLADVVGGGALVDLKTLSYPEGTLRTLLQTCTNLK